MKKFSIFCLVALATTCARAQQAVPTATVQSSRPPLPSGPLLKPAPDNTRWTVISTDKVAQDAKPEEKAAASTAIMGEVIGRKAHVVTVKGTLGRQEQWTDGKLLATLRPGTKEPIYTTSAIERIPMPTWISAQNFSDIKTEGTKSYLIFRTRVLPKGTEIITDLEKSSQEDIEKLKVDATATVDGDTRLPIAVKEGETTTIYKFESLAPDAEIVPAATLAALAEREKKMQDSIHKPVRP